MKIEKDKLLLLTGSIPGKKREVLVKDSLVVAATPQTIANDLKAGRLSLREFGVVVFDECHRAAGRYAYTYIADQCAEDGVQLIGLTASPGSKKEAIDALISALKIENIEIKVSTDPDVEPYMMGKGIEEIHVDKSPIINSILSQLKPVIEQHLTRLHSRGFSPFTAVENLPKGRLIGIGNEIKKIQATNFRFALMFDYVYVLDLMHAYDLISTEGIYPFMSYIEGLRNRDKKSRVVENILKNKNLLGAEELAKSALKDGIEHPKMYETIKLLKNKHSGKSAIVFVQYRSTIKKLVDIMALNGIRARAFVGKKEGVTVASQQQTIADFRDKKFDVLVATSIGEEGLDIPAVDLVIFYEPVASEIRDIQRKGRTGRFRFGDVVILITNGTKDEAYYLVAKIKERKMKEIVMRIKEQLDMGSYNGMFDHKQRRL